MCSVYVPVCTYLYKCVCETDREESITNSCFHSTQKPPSVLIVSLAHTVSGRRGGVGWGGDEDSHDDPLAPGVLLMLTTRKTAARAGKTSLSIVDSGNKSTLVATRFEREVP